MNESQNGEYYRKQKTETIDLIEEIVSRKNLPPVVAYNVAQAQKYIGRAGVKTPDYVKDLYKAMDYLHRALCGEWFHDMSVTPKKDIEARR